MMKVSDCHNRRTKKNAESPKLPGEHVSLLHMAGKIHATPKLEHNNTNGVTIYCHTRFHRFHPHCELMRHERGPKGYDHSHNYKLTGNESSSMIVHVITKANNKAR